MNSELRQKLIRRLDRLTAENEAYLRASDGTDAAVELDQTRQGRLSRMDAMQAQAMSQAARNRARTRLQRLQGARKRLAHPEFGYCIDCEDAIAEARLLHDPAALRCLACAAAREG